MPTSIMGTRLQYLWEQTYTQQKWRLLLHVAFWVAYLSFLTSTAYHHLELSYPINNPGPLLIWLCPVYLSGVYYFFAATGYQQFQKKQLFKGLLFLVIAFVLYLHLDIIFSYFLLLQLKSEHLPTKYQDVNSLGTYYQRTVNVITLLHELFYFGIYLLIPVTAKFFRDTQQSSKKLQELKERNMQLELNLIKSQVSPHFLLNTLNNIYGFTLNGTRPQIGQMILSLSEFLKYSLYECNNEFVPIRKEVQLIENYIELESVRSEFINVSFDHSIGDSNCLVPPFLLFPLVENAFKHGTVNLIKPTHISIHLSVNENKLHLQVENEVMDVKAEEGGIGLSALQKKLAYYYTGNYRLNAGVTGNRYIAQLEISGICKK